MAELVTEHGRSGGPPASRTGSPSVANEACSSETVHEDAVFEVLSASRRRSALRFLHREGGEASVGSIAERVAATENPDDPEAVTPEQRKRAYIALHQSHLPKLAEHGIVEYDRDAGRVRLRPPAGVVLPYLYYSPSGDDLPPVRDTGTALPLGRWVRRVLGR